MTSGWHIKILGAIGGEAMSWNEAPTAPRWIAGGPDELLSQCARLTDWIDGPQASGRFPLHMYLYICNQTVAENMLKISDEFTVILNVE